MLPSDRLAALVLHLQVPGWKTAAALGEQIGVSERTVYRDVQEIQAEAVPVEGAPGHGYRLREGYVLPPIALTRDEAKVLLDKVSGIQQGALRDTWAAETARAKLAALLPAGAPASARSDGRLALFAEVASERDRERRRTEEVAETVAQAMRERLALELSQGGTFQPYAVVEGSRSLRVLGAISRPDRSFVGVLGVEELVGAKLGTQAFAIPAAYQHDEPRPALSEGSSVTVRFDAPGAAAAQRSDLPEGTERIEWEGAGERGERVAAVYTARAEALVVWLMGFGSHAEVLAPESIRSLMLRESERVAALYQRDAPTLF